MSTSQPLADNSPQTAHSIAPPKNHPDKYTGNLQRLVVALAADIASDLQSVESAMRFRLPPEVTYVHFAGSAFRDTKRLLEWCDQVKNNNCAAVVVRTAHVELPAIIGGNTHTPVVAVGVNFTESGLDASAFVVAASLAAAADFVVRLLYPGAPQQAVKARAQRPVPTRRPRAEVSPEDKKLLAELEQNFHPTLKHEWSPPEPSTKPPPLDYSLKLREVISGAQQISEGYRHDALLPIHFLASMLETVESEANRVLEKLAIDFEILAARIRDLFPEGSDRASGTFVPDKSTTAMMALAKQHARSKRRGHVTTGDFLFALAAQLGSAAEALEPTGISSVSIDETLKNLPPEHQEPSPQIPRLADEPIAQLDPEQVRKLQQRIYQEPPAPAAASEPTPAEAQTPVADEEAEPAEPDELPQEEPPRCITCNPSNPSIDVVEEVADYLLDGRLVELVSDTGPALIADATNARAVRRLQSVLPAENGQHTVWIHSASQLKNICPPLDERVENLVDKFWPGPLTLIFPRRARALTSAASGDDIALRIPDHYVTLAILSMISRPVLAATIADLSAIDQVSRIIVDTGQEPQSSKPTVLRTTTTPFEIIQLGLTPQEEIEAVVGEPVNAAHQR